MRKSKYIDGVTYYYLYYGSQLIEQSWGDKKLTFVYDDNGNPYSFYYKSGAGDTAYNGMGSKYYYVLNGQGDIVQIRSSTNAFVAEYHYDAWGKLLYISDNSGNKITSTSSVGVINPLRYRGYYYDTETGFYYLQSRYYDPQMKRFINADGVMGVNSDTVPYNLFAYCGNNPVNRYDNKGLFWSNLVEGFIDALDSMATAIGIDTAALGASFLDMFGREETYHAKFDCWQKYFGYNDLFDRVFDFFTDMLSTKFDFSYNGSDYTIWVWKGDYINLGAGAELGIYRGSGSMVYVDTSIAMYMEMYLLYQGDYIILYGPDEPQWWITGFNPDYKNIPASELTAIFGLWFDNSGMYYAFWDKWKVKESGWTFYPCINLAVLHF